MAIHRRISAVLFAASCLAIVAQAQEGVIAGVVESGGKSLPGVLVGAQAETKTSIGALPAVTTSRSDQNGAFRLTGLKPGKYILMILSPGWVITGGMLRVPPVMEVGVKEAEIIENLKLNAVKGGVITGRVTTADGRPLIGMRVRLSPIGQRGAAITLALIDRAISSKYETDDRGIYRIYGLQPGRYLVSVGSENSVDDPFPLSHYPAGSEKGEPVTVKEGEETSGIDLILDEGKTTFTLQGRLLDARTKQPVSGVPLRYSFQSTSGGSTSRFATNSDAQGAFLIGGLGRGKYTLVAGGDQRSSYYSQPLTVEIVDQNISGLELPLLTAASINGAVVVAGESAGITVGAPGHLLLLANVTDTGRGKSDTRPIAVAPDGRFEIGGLGAGKVQLRLSGQQAADGWWMTGIEYRGETLREGISVQDGERIDGVKIRIMRGTGRIRGRVVVPENLLTSGIEIHVAAQPAEQGPLRIAQFQPPLINRDGTFEITGLLPGIYTLRPVALKAPEQVTKILSRVSQTVAVNHNTETAVDLIIPPEN